MLPKKNRIPKKDFPAPPRQGFRVFSPLFSFVFYKNDTNTQVAVVVSKKTAKTAVARNRIRRRVYSALESFLQEVASPATIVVYPKKEALSLSFKDVKDDAEIALRKAGLL